MPKDISTLIPDIQAVLNSPLGKEKADQTALEIASGMGHRLRRSLNREERPRKPGVLYPSELGHPCHRKTWFDFHYDPITMLPAETIGPATRMKFNYGDVIECIVLGLAKATDHDIRLVDEKIEWEVTGMPQWKVSGRIDMMADGHLVDIKSMAARSYDRWAVDGAKADGFGYSAQLSAYERVVMTGEPTFILAVDKEGGKMTMVPTPPQPVVLLANEKARAAEMSAPPFGKMPPVPDGKSGNQKLGVFCSYCKYKYECWKDSNGGKGLRRFNYSFGPVWLTEVAREPRVQEEI